MDRDNFDRVLAKLGVEMYLPISGESASPVGIRFSELEDFHPDRIYARLEVFQALKETRDNLEDPSAFAGVANELQGGGPPETSEIRSDQNVIPPETAGQGTGGLLERVIEQTRHELPEVASSRPVSEWASFLQEIVRPHLAPDPHPRQEAMLAAVDAAAGELMRMILLPLHIFKEHGESHRKPCAETLLSQRAAEAILEKGAMPLLSFLNQDTVRLARFQAIADPLTQLAGRWDKNKR